MEGWCSVSIWPPEKAIETVGHTAQQISPEVTGRLLPGGRAKSACCVLGHPTGPGPGLGSIFKAGRKKRVEIFERAFRRRMGDAAQTAGGGAPALVLGRQGGSRLRGIWAGLGAGRGPTPEADQGRARGHGVSRATPAWRTAAGTGITEVFQKCAKKRLLDRRP